MPGPFPGPGIFILHSTFSNRDSVIPVPLVIGGDNMQVLVMYYSRTGNTEKLAEDIARPPVYFGTMVAHLVGKLRR